MRQDADTGGWLVQGQVRFAGPQKQGQAQSAGLLRLGQVRSAGLHKSPVRMPADDTGPWVSGAFDTLAGACVCCVRLDVLMRWQVCAC